MRHLNLMMVSRPACQSRGPSRRNLHLIGRVSPPLKPLFFQDSLVYPGGKKGPRHWGKVPGFYRCNWSCTTLSTWNSSSPLHRGILDALPCTSLLALFHRIFMELSRMTLDLQIALYQAFSGKDRHIQLSGGSCCF